MKQYGINWTNKTDIFHEATLSMDEFNDFIAKKGYKIHDSMGMLLSGFISTKGKALNIFFKKEFGHMNEEYYILTKEIGA